MIQRLKMAKRYAPAQQDISAQNNRLMYTLVKLLWLRLPASSQSSPEKKQILKAYERIQHRVLVEDPVLSKMGIPLPKINVKTVRDFIHKQERLINIQATKMPLTISRTTSISSTDLPPAPRQPPVLPPPDYTEVEYISTPSRAGTKALKERGDIFMPTTKMALMSLPPPSMRSFTTGKKTPATCTVSRPTSTISSTSNTRTLMPASQPDTPPPASQPDTSQSSSAPRFWARATVYKRKHADQITGVGAKVSRVQNYPVCSLCLQPTQGHKKYKKKTFCPVKMMSTSKGFENQIYDSYEQFTDAVDKQANQ